MAQLRHSDIRSSFVTIVFPYLAMTLQTKWQHASAWPIWTRLDIQSSEDSQFVIRTRRPSWQRVYNYELISIHGVDKRYVVILVVHSMYCSYSIWVHCPQIPQQYLLCVLLHDVILGLSSNLVETDIFERFTEQSLHLYRLFTAQGLAGADKE